MLAIACCSDMGRVVTQLAYPIPLTTRIGNGLSGASVRGSLLFRERRA